MLLNELFKKTRLEKNLTQQDVAVGAGITVAAYYLVETGRTKNPRKKTLMKICDFLGITNEFLANPE